jgi:hypothetical protein
MASFDSPISRRKFPNPAPMRDLEIPDESGYTQGPLPAVEQSVNPVYNRRANAATVQHELEQMNARLQEETPEDTAEVERQMKGMRQAKLNSQVTLNEGARRRIEMLIDMTRHTRTVDIGGTLFAMQTLKSKEMREAILAASEFDGSVQQPFEIRKQLLVRSLTQIAGVPFSQFVGTDDLLTKMNALDELDDTLLNRLLDEYSLMVKESRDKFAIKTTEDAKELVEDLKK